MTSLSRILFLNAASCLGFGLLFAAAPNAVSTWLGDFPQDLLRWIGFGLTLNGLHLLVASRRVVSNQFEVLWFSTGDLVWWLASMAVLASGWGVTTSLGLASTLVVATVVAGLGLAQIGCIGLSRSGTTLAQHWDRICRSWLGLPLWVKVWLLVLNATFLLAPVFLPAAMAAVILLAYVASGPLLAAYALYNGGLTRVMGVAHLLPWLPLLFWLGLTPATATLVPASQTYLTVLAAIIAVCLAFDIYDLWRWWRGDRTILGLVRTAG